MMSRIRKFRILQLVHSDFERIIKDTVNSEIAYKAHARSHTTRNTGIRMNTAIDRTTFFKAH